jgi:dihydrofolate reductase
MGKLTITTFVTLDGVMQAPGGATEDTSGGFQLGGWVMPHWDETLDAFITDVFTRVDAFLLGRRTYEIFASYWPKATDPKDPVAGALNRLPKHVASRTLERADWGPSTIVRDVAREVPALKDKYKGELQVHGSANLIQTLVRERLYDELNVITFPLIVGGGKRLLEAGATPSGLELVSSKTSARGVVIATYRRSGDVVTAEAPPPPT